MLIERREKRGNSNFTFQGGNHLQTANNQGRNRSSSGGGGMFEIEFDEATGISGNKNTGKNNNNTKGKGNDQSLLPSISRSLSPPLFLWQQKRLLSSGGGAAKQGKSHVNHHYIIK